MHRQNAAFPQLDRNASLRDADMDKSRQKRGALYVHGWKRLVCLAAGGLYKATCVDPQRGNSKYRNDLIGLRFS